jgi:DnaJ-class molecular chaperone
MNLLEHVFYNCKQRSDAYCDTMMCGVCDCCDKNIRIENCKNDNTCPKCYGTETYSYTRQRDKSFYSATKLCNHCGGTGKFTFE